MSQVRRDVDALDADLTDALETIRTLLPAEAAGSIEDDAICALETFVVVALRVFRTIPPNRIRAAARHLEIHARLNGIEVLTLAKTP